MKHVLVSLSVTQGLLLPYELSMIAVYIHMKLALMQLFAWMFACLFKASPWLVQRMVQACYSDHSRSPEV
jgi:ABC-type arginine/histidine transport system permease subunit